ncbi:MAG TPA: hypothetical protein VGK99_24035 [Acidobacteriota bacterium]
MQSEGVTYIARAYGKRRHDGTWAGWLAFHPTTAGKPILRTGQETSQPTRVTIDYWASGLEPVYFEGALERARERQR